jgi:hypothetical protein
MKKLKSFDNYKEIMKFMPSGKSDKELDEAIDGLIKMGMMKIDIDKNRLVLSDTGNEYVEKELMKDE